MRDKCRVEPVVLDEKDKHYITLPDRIWQRKDLMLVAAGSFSCVRTLYIQAVRRNKLAQFLPCLIRRAEYASGRAEQRLADCIRQAGQRPGVHGIIIYASCAEIVTQCDWEQATARAGLPAALPVKVLLRGPLVTRTRKPERELEQLLSEFPEESGEILPGEVPMPPLPPDFCGAVSTLHPWEAYSFLLTPGGCAGCVEQNDGIEADLCLEHSRFNDVELAVGCEESAVKGIAERARASGKPWCVVVGSAVPNLIGTDSEAILAGLTSQGIESRYIPCNGFEPAQVGSAQVLQGMSAFLERGSSREKRVNILGYSGLALGGEQVLELGKQTLAGFGYEAEVWGRGGPAQVKRGADAALNWVVAAEGLPLAKEMERAYGLPYVFGLPLEAYGQDRWGTQVLEAMEQASAGAEPAWEGRGPQILLVGQPSVLKGLSWAIQAYAPNVRIQRAMYAPTQALAGLFQPVCSGSDFCFSDGRELRHQAAAPDLILADPLFRPSILSLFPASNWFDCPDPTVSGRRFLPAGWDAPTTGFWEALRNAIGNIHIQQ